MEEPTQAIPDVQTEMLVRLGTLSGYMQGLAEAMVQLNITIEWAQDLMKEVKKTDELVEIWSSM